MRKKASNNG